MDISQKRVCIIGAGPSGMAQMMAFAAAKKKGESIPEVVCYEKQSAPGGLWNYSWRTGIDEHGDPVHGSMYNQLFSNAPKECLEISEYTFQDHFGKATGSYPPRESLYGYIMTRFKKYECSDWVQCNTGVKMVSFDDDTKKFTVLSRNYDQKKDQKEIFDNVIVACGHFSTPDVPEIEGYGDFKGRIVHAHDVRNAQEFKDQRILVIGTSYSAEDIASMCWKNGSKKITVCYRSKAMPYEWPEIFDTKPLLTKVKGDTVTFKDGSQADYDTIIMATGYLHHFPWMEESLRLSTPNIPYPNGLYKGICWHQNPQLFYLGMQAQAYTLPMFDAQSYYARDVILGKISIPDESERQKDIDFWLEGQGKIDGTVAGFVAFQGSYVQDLIDATDYPKWDILAVNKLWVQWRVDKEENIMTFRDKTHTSAHTGVTSTVPQTKWTEQFDFSDEAFRKNNCDSSSA